MYNYNLSSLCLYRFSSDYWLIFIKMVHEYGISLVVSKSQSRSYKCKPLTKESTSKSSSDLKRLVCLLSNHFIDTTNV